MRKIDSSRYKDKDKQKDKAKDKMKDKEDKMKDKMKEGKEDKMKDKIMSLKYITVIINGKKILKNINCESQLEQRTKSYMLVPIYFKVITPVATVHYTPKWIKK